MPHRMTRTTIRTTRSRSAVLAFLLAIPATIARGAELVPGESAGPPAVYYDGPLESDELVTSRSGTFEFTAPDGEGGTRVFQGGYAHAVYRNGADRTLSFRFGASGADSGGREVDLEGLSASGFAGFLTDVQVTGQRFVSRSTDEGTIDVLSSDSPSVGIFVRTNATAFGGGGNLTYDVSFQPTPSHGVAVFEAFRPVPEPGGAVALIGVGAALMRRRAPGRRGGPREKKQLIPPPTAATAVRRLGGARSLEG